jgi:polysaccharide biosynthesis transport protein
MKDSITRIPPWQQVPSRQLPLPPQEPQSGLGRNDILFALFRHKKMILVFALLGLIAAVAVYFFYPQLYKSEAKLLVRYVLDRRTVDPVDSSSSSTQLAATSDSIINSEVEILTSWDLAVQVAEAIGPKRLLRSGTAPSKEIAAGIVAKGLTVTAHPGSSIIYVEYQNSDPELATQVLSELLSRYFVKHLEVHRSAGAFDFVSQQTDQVRTRLNQTEDALKEARAKAGIVSLAEGTAALSAELTRTEEQLSLAEADLAEQRARVEATNSSSPTGDTETPVKGVAKSAESTASVSPTNAVTHDKPELPDKVVQQYQVVINRLADLRKSELDLLSKFAPGSVMVQVTRAQISDLSDEKQALEKKYPGLPTQVLGATSSGQPGNTLTEGARLAGMEAKTKALRSRLQELRGRMKQLAELAPTIGDLERKKELEENNYKYFANTLEKARVDEALDPSKIPNISAVQRPSPPAPVTGKQFKIVLGCAAGGLALGIALALLRELILNQTLKRPTELEAQLQTSLLLAIPDASSNGHLSLPPTGGADTSTAIVQSRRGNLAPWDSGHFIRTYCEAIRDRIGLYFDLHQLTHKPKLVGVAAFSQGAGTSTLAAGLAAALSETDEGKVLLVDVNLGPDHVHPFFKGKPAYPLTTALQPSSSIDAASENLYLATVGSSQTGLAQLGLKKFFDLMPNLKASDFDYIIFDMPPLASTSPTWGMAAFMDKLLLVVEAEKNNRDLVKRGYAKLMAERNNVSVVLNKTRSYIPKALDTES